MSPDNTVVEFPNWKTFATAEERFLELARIARRNPERFARMIVVYQEDLPKNEGQINPPTLTRYICGGEYINTSTALGLLELAKLELLRYTHNF